MVWEDDMRLVVVMVEAGGGNDIYEGVGNNKEEGVLVTTERGVFVVGERVCGVDERVYSGYS